MRFPEEPAFHARGELEEDPLCDRPQPLRARRLAFAAEPFPQRPRALARPVAEHGAIAGADEPDAEEDGVDAPAAE